MKKILLVILGFAGLLSPFTGKSQTASFSTVADTVWATVTTLASPGDLITNNTSSPLTLKWHVDTTDFPADWLAAAAFGICDNVTCYGNGTDITNTYPMQLWNDTTHFALTFTSNPYAPGPNGPFNLSLNLTGLSTGTHFVTIDLTQPLGTSKKITFVINKVNPSAISQINNVANDIVLYPNPATNELNLVYDANSDVKNVAVYNIIGKVMTVYKVSGNSANLNIENMPSGIYFLRLYNSTGNVIATRKFTKQ